MMITSRSFEDKAAGYLERCTLEIVQINLGNLCNQACLHCHVGGSPRGTRNMDFKTVEKIISSISAGDLVGQKILTDTHCFSCTAGSGSSCGGALT